MATALGDVTNKGDQPLLFTHPHPSESDFDFDLRIIGTSGEGFEDPAVFGLGGRLPYVERESVAALAGLKTGWLRGRVDLPRLEPLP